MYERLRQLRHERKTELKDLLLLLGVNKPTYYRKEVGSIKFSLEEAKKISAYFGLPIEQIFFKYEVEENETSVKGA